MDLNAIEAVLYVIAASFAVGLLVTLVIGGLRFWLQWLDDRINRNRGDDAHR